MKSYLVTAELVDYRDGKRYVPAAPGDDPVTFAPADAAHADRLIAAGCISGDVTFDGLGKDPAEMTRAELEAAAFESFRQSMAGVSDDELRAALARHCDALAAAELFADPSAESGGDDDDADDDDDDDGDDDDGEDGLGQLKVAELKDLAEKETVDLAGLTRKADLIGAIRRARSAEPTE